jgi:lipopolysaccharide export system protein LptC
MTYKNIFISFLMMVTMGLAAWTALLSLRPQKISTHQNTSLPDAFMEDVISIVMDKEGNPKMQIITPKMIHFVENDTTHLTTPKLTLYRKSPIPWQVTSKFAKATQGTEKVNFWDDVLIRHPGDNNNPATVIKTPTLTIHPNKNIAETNDFITLIQPNLEVNATGMRADMNTGDIKLMSRARGAYVPNS